MFDYCSLVQKKCPFAAKRGDLTYCGLHKGYTLAENRVDYLGKCPKEKLKKKEEIVMPYHKGRKKKKKGKKK